MAKFTGFVPLEWYLYRERNTDIFRHTSGELAAELVRTRGSISSGDYRLVLWMNDQILGTFEWEDISQPDALNSASYEIFEALVGRQTWD